MPFDEHLNAPGTAECECKNKGKLWEVVDKQFRSTMIGLVRIFSFWHQMVIGFVGWLPGRRHSPLGKECSPISWVFEDGFRGCQDYR